MPKTGLDPIGGLDGNNKDFLQFRGQDTMTKHDDEGNNEYLASVEYPVSSAQKTQIFSQQGRNAISAHRDNTFNIQLFWQRSLSPTPTQLLLWWLFSVPHELVFFSVIDHISFND